MRLKIVFSNLFEGAVSPSFGGGGDFSYSDIQTIFGTMPYFYVFFDYGDNRWSVRAPQFYDLGGGEYSPEPLTHEGHPAFIINIDNEYFTDEFVAAFQESQEFFVSMSVPEFTYISFPTLPNYSVGQNTVLNFWVFDADTGDMLASFGDSVEAVPSSPYLPYIVDPFTGTHNPVGPWRKVTLGAPEPQAFWTGTVLCSEV